MTVEEILASFSAAKPPCTAVEPSFRLLHSCLYMGGMPRSSQVPAVITCQKLLPDLNLQGSAEEKQMAVIAEFWGQHIADIFTAHFQDRNVTNDTQAQYKSRLYNKTPSGQKDLSGSFYPKVQQMLLDHHGIIDEIYGRCEAILQKADNQKRNDLKKVLVWLGFCSLIQALVDGDQIKWDKASPITDYFHQIPDKYILATKAMLVGDWAAILTRIVLEITLGSKDGEKTLSQYWLPDNKELLKMAEADTEAACYVVQYFLSCEQTESANQAINIMLSQMEQQPAADLPIGALLDVTEQFSKSIPHRKNAVIIFNKLLYCSMGTDARKRLIAVGQELLRAMCGGCQLERFYQVLETAAQEEDMLANSLLGKAWYYRWVGQWADEDRWMRDLLPEMESGQKLDETAITYLLRGEKAGSGTEKITEKGRKWQAELQTECRLFLARVKENQGKLDDACTWYENASRHGQCPAAAKALRNISTLQGARGIGSITAVSSLPIQNRPARYVFLAGQSAPYQEFVRTLPPDNWDILLYNTETAKAMGDLERLQGSIGPSNTLFTYRWSLPRAITELFADVWASAHLVDPPKLICAFLEDDQEQNVRECTVFLQTLSKILDKGVNQCGKDQLLDYIATLEVYVSVNSDFCVGLLDSIQQEIDDQYNFYIPVNIINRNTHAAQQLLTRHPLFLPVADANDSNAPVRLVVIGTSPCAMEVVKESIGVYIAAHPLRVSIIGPGAKNANAQFMQECPGLYSQKWLSEHVTVKFYQCELEQLPLYAVDSQTNVSEALQSGDYFVIATESDSRNLELAVKLRQSILTRDETFTRRPLIAVKCGDSVDAWLAKKMPVAKALNNGEWYSDYQLHYFGTNAMFSYSELKDGLIEQRAKKIHLSYTTVTQEQPLSAYHALRDYYLRYYNRQSSRAMAVRLIYRVFDAHIMLPKEKIDFYGDSIEEDVLGEQYGEWLSGPYVESRLTQAARSEQIRWSLQLAAHGWQPTSAECVERYVEMGVKTHQLYIAKLHPYLREWDQLEPVYEKISELFRTRLKKELTDPRETTKQSIRDTAAFFKRDK